jgi:hypothetical protein
MTPSKGVTHYNVFTVERFDTPTEQEPGCRAKSWTKQGAAYPRKEGAGFSIELNAFPVARSPTGDSP